MSDDLGLSLDKGKKREKGGNALIVTLLVIVVALAALDLVHFFRSWRGPGGDPAVIEKLALKLEKQELYTAAADAWVEYLETGAPEEQERARIWYRIGRMRERAGDCERALAAYYRSEQTAELKDVGQEISLAVERCLTRLARFSALRSEIAGRTSVGDAGEAGSEVLAEIGSEKITRDMLDAMIEAEVDVQVAQAAAGMPEDQVREQREKVLGEVMSGTDMGMWLERLVAEEVLFRYAMEEDLQHDPDMVEMSRRLERKLLTTHVLAREYAEKVSVSEDEMRAWYRDNASKISGGAGREGGQTPPFDEVKDQVYAAVRLEKERAAQSALLEKLIDRYDVVIHRSKLDKPARETGE